MKNCKRGVSVTPRLRLLHRSSRHSNSFSLILPIFTHKTRSGKNILTVDPNEMSKFLNLDEDGIVQLTRRFLYPKQNPSRLKHILLDRRALAEQYTELINAGMCNNQADVARHFGVSRAWVTKIMNTMRPQSTGKQ